MTRSGHNSFFNLVCVTALVAISAQALITAPAAAEGKEDNVIYVLGVAVSESIKPFTLSEDELKVFIEGLGDGVRGTAGDIDPRAHVAKIQALQIERQAAFAAAERKLADQFIANAANEEGATQYDSGLILTTISEGSGASPKPTDTVKVHYHGTLRNGTVFDSSVQRNTPAEFPLNRVIPCWTEGVGMMKVGGKSRLICPSSIAYGDQGSPPKIPGGAALVFEVELLEIVTAGN